jgi:hypothetical protein
MQQLRNDARTAGEAIAKAFIDTFAESNRSPSQADLIALEETAGRYFAARPIQWTDEEIVQAWREGIQSHLTARLREFRRPLRTASSAPLNVGPTRTHPPGVTWSSPFGITR